MSTSALVLTNGLPIMTSITASLTAAYDQSISYPTGLAATTAITLPSSGSFSSATAADIIIILNSLVVAQSSDFTVLGGGPSYTQIEFNYALPNNSIVRFKSHLA